MFFVELIFVLVTVLLITSLFSACGVRCGPWPGVLWLFVMLFLVTWALGIWIRPIGPPLWGAYWVPYLLVAFFLAVLLAATAPAPPQPPVQPPGATPLPGSRTRAEVNEEAAEEEAAVVTTLNVFFWLVLLLAVIAIVVHYARPSFVVDAFTPPATFETAAQAGPCYAAVEINEAGVCCSCLPTTEPMEIPALTRPRLS